MLYRRRHSGIGSADILRFGFADASPQGKRNWLVIRMQAIEKSKLLEVMDAAHRLAVDAAQHQEAADCDDYPALPDEEEEDQKLNRVELADVIFQNMLMQTLPPVALGLGKSRVVDKVAAFIYSVCLEAGFANLSSVLESVCAFTTDMGAEVGMNDFAGIDFISILPKYPAGSQIYAETV